MKPISVFVYLSWLAWAPSNAGFRFKYVLPCLLGWACVMTCVLCLYATAQPWAQVAGGVALATIVIVLAVLNAYLWELLDETSK